MNDDDDDAAPTAVWETTEELTEYKHPENPMISFVELPGMGTPKYPHLQTFCEKINVDVYDVFLILTSTRFTGNDLELARKVKSMRKLFFLVRTKIDVSCDAERRRKRSARFDEILKRIRDDCMANVQIFLGSDDHVFLISNYHRDKWDFERLAEAIYAQLPKDQGEVLIPFPKAGGKSFLL